MASIRTASWMQFNPFATSFAAPMGSVWGSTAKVPFWRMQTKKIPGGKLPLPSLTTTAKVAGVGTIAYGGYKVSESVGRFTETGSFTKKELKTGVIDTPTDSLSGLVIAGEKSPIYNILPEQTYPGTGSFVGDIGAGLGRGAGETGEGIGSGLSMAIPILAVGGLAYILLKEKKGKK